MAGLSPGYRTAAAGSPYPTESAQPYRPSLRDIAAQGLLATGMPDTSVRGMLGSIGLGQNPTVYGGAGLADYTPLAIPFAVNEHARGDNLAAIGAIPGAGPAKGLAGSAARKSAGMFGDLVQGAAGAVQKRGDEILGLLRGGRAKEVTDDMLVMGDPAETARLNAYLYDNYDLPMDEASRAARAVGVGMSDEPLFHGSASDIQAIVPTRRSFYLTDRPDVADIYSASAGRGGPDIRARAANAGPNTAPVRVAGPQIAYSDIGPDGSHGWMTDNYADALAYDGALPGAGVRASAMDAKAREQGYRTARMTDMLDLGGEQTQVRVLDPTAIRSKWARFDPRLSHLRNLSAGVGGAALGLGSIGLLADPSQAQAKPMGILGYSTGGGF